MKRSVVLSVLFSIAVTACSKPEQPSIGLYPAIQRGDIEQIERHIYWGTDINEKDIDGRRPLHVAAAQGELVVVKLLLENGVDIDGRDGDGQTPLHHAVIQGRTQVAALLLKEGALFDADEMLDRAVMRDIVDRDIVRFLARYGADLDHIDPSGATPLMRAIERANRVLVKHLITHGADVNRPDGNGTYPLTLATEKGDADIIDLLLRNGASAGPGA